MHNSQAILIRDLLQVLAAGKLVVLASFREVRSITTIEELKFWILIEGAKHATTVFFSFFFDEFDGFIERDGKRIDTLGYGDVLVVVAHVWAILAYTDADGFVLKFS